MLGGTATFNLSGTGMVPASPAIAINPGATRKDTLRIRVDGRRMVLRDDWTGTVEWVDPESAEAQGSALRRAPGP